MLSSISPSWGLLADGQHYRRCPLTQVIKRADGGGRGRCIVCRDGDYKMVGVGMRTRRRRRRRGQTGIHTERESARERNRAWPYRTEKAIANTPFLHSLVTDTLTSASTGPVHLLAIVSSTESSECSCAAFGWRRHGSAYDSLSPSESTDMQDSVTARHKLSYIAPNHLKAGRSLAGKCLCLWEIYQQTRLAYYLGWVKI